MSWRDDFEPGSFRGVPFKSISGDRSGGRRLAVHEFPQRDETLVEDLGRAARRFSIEVFVWGDDYRTQRDALIDALEAFGTGTLVHPWHGRRSVSIEAFTASEHTDDGGYCSFQIECVEAAEAPPLDASQDTGDQARDTADAVLEEAPAAFADDFDISGLPAFVEDAAAKLVSGVSSLAQFSAALSGGAGPVLRAFDSGLRLLGVSGLLHTPLALGQSIIGLISALSVLDTRPRTRIAALKNMASYGSGLKPVFGATPARNRQRENQEALVHIVRVAASAELVRAISETGFNSYEEATATRDWVAELLDGHAIAAADAGRDDRADAFEGLLRAMVRDVSARGGTLARLYAYRPDETQPALVIANRLYGASGDIEAQVADLVARNSIRHPGFVPGGAALKVLTHG